MKPTRIFTCFLKQLQRQPSPQQFHSTKSILQSSIGIIFKCHTNTNISNTFKSINHIIQNQSSIHDVSILMVQRGGYQKDINAYNVVFPGGQADGDQADLEACSREIMEEVNLDVSQSCIYAGKIPCNFYYARKKGKYLHISCNVWVLRQDSKYEPKLNPDQLVDYRWVPLCQIIDIGKLKTYDAKQFGFFRRLAWPFLRESVKNNLVTVSFPSLDIGMKRDLWGLTLWLVSYMLQMSAANIQANPKTEDDNGLLKQLQIIRQRAKEIQIVFRRSYIIGVPMVWIAKGWHHIYRVRQFTYNREKNKIGEWLGVALIILILITSYMIII